MAGMDVKLKAGQHTIRLNPEFPIDVFVATDATARASIRTGQDSSGHATLESVTASFEQPLVIRNVFGIVRGYRGLFENNEATAFVDRLVSLTGKFAGDFGSGIQNTRSGMKLLRKVLDSASERVPEVADFARKSLNRAGTTLASFVGEPIALEITRVVARPRVDRLRPDADPLLALSISGSLVLTASGRKASFKDIEVPSVLAPRPGIILNDFVKGRTPTGDTLRTGALVLAPMASDLADVVESVSGRVDAEIVVPTIEAVCRFPDRTDAKLSFWTDQPAITVSSHFDAVPDGSEVKVKLRDLTFRSSGSRRAFVCEAALDARLGFEDGRLELQHMAGTLRQVNRGSLPVFLLRVSGENQLVKSGSAITVRVDELKSSGAVHFSIDAGGMPQFTLPSGTASFSGMFSLPEQQLARFLWGSLSGGVDRGRVECRVSTSDDGTIDLAASGSFPATIEISGQAQAIPELNVAQGPVDFFAQALGKFDLGAQVRLDSDETYFKPRGSVTVDVEKWTFDSAERCMSSVGPLTAKLSVREDPVSRTDEGDFTVDLCWASSSTEVDVGTCATAKRHRFPSAFAQGSQTVHMSPSGRVTLASGGRSFIRPEIWNAMMYPATQAGALLDLLNDDAFVNESLTSAAELVDLFDEKLGAKLFAARDLVLSIRGHLKDLGVRKPGDIFVESTIARLFSRILCGDDRLLDRTMPIVSSVNRGGGLDTGAAKLLILECLPNLNADYEINWILDLIRIAVTPVGLFAECERAALPPLTEVPEIAARLKRLPTAQTIYDWVSKPGLSPDRLARIVELAPMMYIDQLTFIVSQLEGSGQCDKCVELRRIVAAKKAISRACGGNELLDIYLIPRASVLAGFIGDLTGPIPGIDGDDDVPESILGPKDVANVLEVNLATPWQGVQHQLNNRMVLELLKRRDESFLIAVMSELSHDVPLTLALNLIGFFRQEQGWMKEPVDTEALFEEKTGLVVPRFEDFTAGGLRSRESYFAALMELARVVVERGALYRATRMKLREAVPRRVPTRRSERLSALESAARESILAADNLAKKKGITPGSVAPLSAAYGQAFERCADLLDADRCAFQADWFKDFWRRSEEAIRVGVCVANHRDNNEQMRAWLARFDPSGAGRRLSGRAAADFDETQVLVDAVIDTVWHAKSDRDAVRKDPLARLLMPVPDGRYDFTVVSGMGVITDGSQGLEMQAAFERLARTRGINVLRSPTGLMRDLEFNARAIINTIYRVEGPWGYLGYSQGCANGLRAEHMLVTGTPHAREAASRLVTRNLVFSAANGSVHGSSGTQTGAKVLAEAERYFKPYQSLYSREFARFMQRATRGLLDSRQATSIISGAWSLTLARADDLHRNGVFLDTVPTSTVRGAVTPDRLPDGLRFVYGMHQRLMPGGDTDSQVATIDEVGHSTRVTNTRTDVLDRCDIGTRPIHAHHWGPIHQEALQLMTADDAANCRYDNPHDIYVFPWIDTCIRFGLIKPIRNS